MKVYVSMHLVKITNNSLPLIGWFRNILSSLSTGIIDEKTTLLVTRIVKKHLGVILYTHNIVQIVWSSCLLTAKKEHSTFVWRQYNISVLTLVDFWLKLHEVPEIVKKRKKPQRLKGKLRDADRKGWFAD